MKIKTKKQMTHEEYAKHMIDKFGIASYERELIDNNIFDAPMEFEQTFTLNSMRKDDDPVIERSFKGVVVEVEETVTKDTELHYIYLITNNTSYSEGYYNYSINDILSDNEGYYQELAMLIMDPEPTIIWTREKGLVE